MRKAIVKPLFYSTFIQPSYLSKLCSDLVRACFLTKKFRCDQCGQTFSAKPSLNRHIIVMHLKVEQHQCKLCHGMFAKGGILEEHIALSHLGFKTEKEWRKARYVYQILGRAPKVFPRGEFSNHRLLRNLSKLLI